MKELSLHSFPNCAYKHSYICDPINSISRKKYLCTFLFIMYIFMGKIIFLRGQYLQIGYILLFNAHYFIENHCWYLFVWCPNTPWWTNVDTWHGYSASTTAAIVIIYSPLTAENIDWIFDKSHHLIGLTRKLVILFFSIILSFFYTNT